MVVEELRKKGGDREAIKLEKKRVGDGGGRIEEERRRLGSY